MVDPRGAITVQRVCNLRHGNIGDYQDPTGNKWGPTEGVTGGCDWGVCSFRWTFPSGECEDVKRQRVEQGIELQ